jgi:tetratricopeptide (TPR) repeat protein
MGAKRSQVDQMLGREAVIPELAAALAAYDAALVGLRADSAAPAVLTALLARDDLATRLRHAPAPDAATLTRLAGLDEQLKKLAPAAAYIVTPSVWLSWRESRQPPAAAWWWRLDERAASAPPRFAALWPALAGLCITVSLSLTADISRRFLSGGSDFVGAFSTLTQALLALIAGSSFTRLGREQIERLLARMGVSERAYPYWKTGLALAVLLLVGGLRLSLPAIAGRYNSAGVEQQAAGRVSRAIESYLRAISLHPDYTQAHYNLAAAYEDVLDWDKALVEYQTAIRSDPQLYPAYNNLARLYILRRLDYTSALTLLNAALSSPSAIVQQPAVGYALLKNRAWAHLGLKLYGLAEADARAALALRPEGAAAHCLLAQVIEARGALPAALPAWEACLGFAGGETVEANWLATAQERLAPAKAEAQ